MQDIVPDLLLPQVSRLLLHQAWLVGTNNREGEITVNNILESKEVEEILETQGPLVHDLRKEAKRTRYLMEIFPQFYDEKYKTYLGDVKTIQTILGEIQDSFVLGNFLTEVFTQDFRQTMPNLADQLTTNRYNKWQEWQQLQQKLLSPQTRQDFHKTILHPLAANIVAETVTKEEP
jgi:CHAD domain-containing protein